MKKNTAGSYIIDIRDQRVRGGRLTLSTRTGRKPDARRREAAVRALLDQGEYALIERLRDRTDPLRIEDLTRAHEEGALDGLRAAGGLKLGAAADTFLQRVAAELAPETHRQYEIILRFAREEFGDDADPAKIGPDQWRDWLTAPKETTAEGEPWSNNRQTLAYAALNRFYGEMIKDEDDRAHRLETTPRIARNPFARISRQWQRTRAEFLRVKEWLNLDATVVGTPKHAMMGLGCLAGLRASETCNLRPGIDIVLDGPDPRIDIQPREGEFLWYPKGYPRHTNSVRTIPLRMFPTLLAILRRHVELGYAGERYFIRVPGFDRPPSRQWLADQTKEAFKAAGIRYGRRKDALTYHSLRHTFISWLVQEDYSLMKIEKLAGTSVRMIQDVYGHLVDENLDQGMAILERRVSTEEGSHGWHQGMAILERRVGG